jgi:hypothetical protein
MFCIKNFVPPEHASNQTKFLSICFFLGICIQFSTAFPQFCKVFACLFDFILKPIFHNLFQKMSQKIGKENFKKYQKQLLRSCIIQYDAAPALQHKLLHKYHKISKENSQKIKKSESKKVNKYQKREGSIIKRRGKQSWKNKKSYQYNTNICTVTLIKI